LALNTLNKKPIIYFEEDIPSIYGFLPGREFVRIYDEKPDKYELVIALDTGDLQRLGKRVEIFNDADMTVNIDHHPTNTYFAQLNLVNTKLSGGR